LPFGWEWADLHPKQPKAPLDRLLNPYTSEVLLMPRVAIRTGFVAPDGREEQLAEFMCDATGCPNIATSVAGFVREIGGAVVLCDEHAAALKRQPKGGSESS
jgi:hypothetical protein